MWLWKDVTEPELTAVLSLSFRTMLTSLKLQTSWSNTSWPQRATSWKAWCQTPSRRSSTPGRRAALAASNNERRARRWDQAERTQSRKRGTGRRRGLLSLTCGAVCLLWSQPVLKILVCYMFVLSVLNYKQTRACKLKITRTQKLHIGFCNSYTVSLCFSADKRV